MLLLLLCIGVVIILLFGGWLRVIFLAGCRFVWRYFLLLFLEGTLVLGCLIFSTTPNCRAIMSSDLECFTLLSTVYLLFLLVLALVNFNSVDFSCWVSLFV